MFGRRKTAAPSNVDVMTVPVFAPDPRGAALFHGITDGNAARLNSAVRIDARGDGMWSGWTKAPQVVQAPAGRLGSVRAVVDANGATIDQAAGTIISDPMQRIFTERMASRGRS